MKKYIIRAARALKPRKKNAKLGCGEKDPSPPISALKKSFKSKELDWIGSCIAPRSLLLKDHESQETKQASYGFSICKKVFNLLEEW